VAGALVDGPELAIDADPQLLASAAINLLQNAFKYMPAGGTVTLGAFRPPPRWSEQSGAAV
jgi:signal transduction histidine kinase